MAEMSRTALDLMNTRARAMSESGYLRLWRYSEDGEKIPGVPVGCLGVGERVAWAPTVSLTATEPSDGWMIEDASGAALYAQAVSGGISPGRTLTLDGPVFAFTM